MKTTVEVIEHDSWSGSSVAYTKTFARKCDATRHINKVNGQNTASVVPECYYTAHIKEKRVRWLLY